MPTPWCTRLVRAALVAVASFAVPLAASANAIDSMVNDMYFNGEGVPHGVPDTYNWKYRGRVNHWTYPPAGSTRIIHWGQVYEDQNLNPSANTRVHIRNSTLYVRWGTTWYLIQRYNRVAGAHYREDFGNNNQNWGPGDVRNQEDGSSVRAGSKSSTSLGGGLGRNFHYFAPSVVTLNPNSSGVCAWSDYRLVLHNANGTDDRSRAKYLIGVGVDFYNNTGWIGDAGISRFRYVRNGWERVYMQNLPEATLRANPPPTS
jgi:hypothetical protein